MEPFLNTPFLNLTEIQDLARFYRETDKKGNVSLHLLVVVIVQEQLLI